MLKFEAPKRGIGEEKKIEINFSDMIEMGKRKQNIVSIEGAERHTYIFSL